ncbi:MAG: hypothetical protein JSW34_03105 [Candidatus Zixiibacteriota bacterium]|nr:MAG: hypothetical protein JSW34_03105 [candidate division Zixibacteria bacterium]
MKKRITAFSATFVIVVITVTNTLGWDVKEHRLLADSVYHATLREYATPLGDTAFAVGDNSAGPVLPCPQWDNLSFGRLCARHAADDFAPARFQKPGRTILQQLQNLTPDAIAAGWQAALHRALDTGSVPDGDNLQQLDAPNVVCGYLLHHLMALRLAGHSESLELTEQQTLLAALHWEAVALGYLADAFSSGHLLVPRFGPLAGLQKRNHVEAHNHFRHEGVYVINSRGDVWQTFGDRLMHWYAPTYRAVFEASRCSLIEVLLVFHQTGGYPIPGQLQAWLDSNAPDVHPDTLVSSWLSTRNGADYYEVLRMPALLLIPMPIAATWSLRTADQDEHGIRRRHHYPQLSDAGLHDPDLTAGESEFLYDSASVPAWLIPPPLSSDLPVPTDSLIRKDPNWASVRWIQDRHAPPSYKGVLLHVGGQLTIQSGKVRSGSLLGIGYGIWDDLILFKNVSASALIMPSVHEPRRLLLVTSLGGGLGMSIGRLKALRVDGGLAVGLRSDYGEVAPVLSVGVDSRVWPLYFTNAGITVRFKYQWFYFDELLHGPSLELILH